MCPNLPRVKSRARIGERMGSPVPACSGNGLAQHPMLYVGENCNKMFLVKDDKVI